MQTGAALSPSPQSYIYSMVTTMVITILIIWVNFLLK